MITAWVYLVRDSHKPLESERLGEFRFVAVPAMKDQFEVWCSTGHQLVEVVNINHWPVPVSPDEQPVAPWAQDRRDPSVHLVVHIV